MFSLVALIGTTVPLASAQDLTPGQLLEMTREALALEGDPTAIDAEEPVPSVPIEKPEAAPVNPQDSLPSLGSLPSTDLPPPDPYVPAASPRLYSDRQYVVGVPEHKFRGSLGFAHVSGEGWGPGVDTNLRFNALEVEASLQATVDGNGTPHLPQLDLAVGLRNDRASVRKGDLGLSLAFYLKLAFDRNTALDREGGGRVQGGATWKASTPNVTFQYDGSIAAGVRDSGDDAIFYLEERNRANLELCALPTADDKFCADVWADLAVGLIQAEAMGGLGVSYQRRINDNRGKAFIRAGVEGTGTADFAGTHSYSKVGLTAGGAF